MSKNKELQVHVGVTRESYIARNIKFKVGDTDEKTERKLLQLVETYDRILELESKFDGHLGYEPNVPMYFIFAGSTSNSDGTMIGSYTKNNSGVLRVELGDEWYFKVANNIYSSIKIKSSIHDELYGAHFDIMKKGVDETIYLSEPVGDIMLYWDDVPVIDGVLLGMGIIKKPLFYFGSIDKTSERFKEELLTKIKERLTKITVTCSGKSIDIYEITEEVEKIRTYNTFSKETTNAPKLMICQLAP